MIQEDLEHGLVEGSHDLHIVLAGDEEERIRGDGSHHLGTIAAQHTVHIAVDAAFGQGLGHLVAFLEEERLEGKTVLGGKALHHVILEGVGEKADAHAVEGFQIHVMHVAHAGDMQIGVLVSGTQFGKAVEPGTLGREADAAGKVDGAVVQALGQLVEADLDPLVFPSRIARDGREQGHGIAGKVFPFTFENAVLVEIAHTDDLGCFIIGGDVFGREKMESRPVQGQARFRLDRGLPGGGGESSLGNGRSRQSRKSSKVRSMVRSHIMPPHRRHGITAGTSRGREGPFKA